MGSHSRIMARAAAGELSSPSNGHMWPVQWRTCNKKRSLCLKLQDVDRKSDSACYKCINSTTFPIRAHSLSLLKVCGDTGPSILQIWCWPCAPCWSECSSFAGRSWSLPAFLSSASCSNLKTTHQEQNKPLFLLYKTVQERFRFQSTSKNGKIIFNIERILEVKILC